MKKGLFCGQLVILLCVTLVYINDYLHFMSQNNTVNFKSGNFIFDNPVPD